MEITYVYDDEAKVAFSQIDIELMKKGIEQLISIGKDVNTDILHVCRRAYDPNGFTVGKAITMHRITFDTIYSLMDIGSGLIEVNK